jgi:thiamine-monophosphate kinase
VSDEVPEETVADTGEFGLISRVTRGRVQPGHTLLGPGDDAAVVAAPDGRVVASTDVLVEHVHFRLDWSTARQIGRKAAAVNLADIAAMGAVPTALLVGLGCPPGTPAAVAEGLADGLWEEGGRAGVGVVGGDVVSAPSVMLSVTVLGGLEGRDAVTRSGGRPGDVVALAGRVGWSAAGLAVLSGGDTAGGDTARVSAELSPAVEAVLAAHRVPDPPYAAGPAAARAGATAMIDISDGLLSDLGHVADSSQVRIDLRAAALPVPVELVQVAALLEMDPLRWMLTGGEDHALAAAFPARCVLPPGWSVIGSVHEGTGISVDGARYSGVQGWDHFTG